MKRALNRSRFDAARTRGLSAFRGRKRELEHLGDALARAQAGRGQFVAVRGERTTKMSAEPTSSTASAKSRHGRLRK